MRSPLYLVAVVSLLFSLGGGPAQAVGSPYLTTGVANWAVFDNADREALHVTYTLAPLPGGYNVRPTLMAFFADQGQQYYAFGVAYDSSLGPHWRIGGAMHIGFMERPKQLGHKVEYYTRLNVDRRLSPQWYMRLEIGHISNAGLGDQNPGSEAIGVSLIYHFD